MNYEDMDRPRRLRMPRSRGAVTGLLLVALGVWGALIPFVGPHFNFAYTPDQDWVWTSARGWLEVLPGATAVVGGLLLLVSRNRASAMLGAWLAVAAGAWFVVGVQVAPLVRVGQIGDPVAATDRKRALLEVTYFSGLGALMVFLGGVALARLAFRLARDVRPLDTREARKGHEPVAAVPEIQPYAPPMNQPAPVHQPAMHQPAPVQQPAADVSTSATTKAREEVEPQHKWNFPSFRRHHETAAAGPPQPRT